ncbi:MAG: sigma 54-interacting transcriptional regulator [Planctomycetes bacterium]|nr:sigma 54-interacting transcriptional regulator [Planctomycetota bacterium]
MPSSDPDRRKSGRHKSDRRRLIESEETEPLPLPEDLAAFAKDPLDAKRKLLARDADAARRKGFQKKPMRPEKLNQPITNMRPANTQLETRRLARLLDINKAINREHDLGPLLDRIMDAAIELSNARRGFLVLWDRGEMQVARARNIGKGTISSPEAAISRHLIKEALDRRETVITAQAAEERDKYASATGLDLKSVMVSPLMQAGRVMGAIYLDEPEKVGVFQDDDVATVEAFCDQAAIALLNARAMNELKTRMESQRLRLRRVEAEVRRRDEDEVRRFGNLVTHSPKLKRVFDLLARVAETPFPVIVQGESGTGKELLAKAIHYSSLRKDQPFIAMNCAAVPETLLDSELFGYQAGAFTGAVRGHKGLFEQADKGSLFLDEIEEMSPAMQGKLLRVLQESEVRRVGGKSTVKIDVRVIAATNVDIQEMVNNGDFRRDLYYRLNVIPVVIPPLRERREDLPTIINDLLARLVEPGQELPVLEDEAFDAIMRYDFPGNVRELENELKRLQALGVQQIRKADLSDKIRYPESAAGGGGGGGGGEAHAGLPTLNIKDLERLTIARALAESKGNKTHAAKVLGLSRRGLLKKLERYRADGIDLGDEDIDD